MKVNSAIITVELVDEETGELTNQTLDIAELVSERLSTVKKKTTKKSTTKKVEDNDPTPRLILMDNKYSLNNAAIELLGAEEGDKIDIKYEVKNKKRKPVIGTADSFGTKGGNKLTKSNTVSYRGKNNDELSEYGTEFTIGSAAKTEGTFYLISEAMANETPEVEDAIDEINVEDEIASVTPDVDDAAAITLDDLNFDL